MLEKEDAMSAYEKFCLAMTMSGPLLAVGFWACGYYADRATNWCATRWNNLAITFGY